MTKRYLIPALLSGVFSVVIGSGAAFAQSTTNTTSDDHSDAADHAVEPNTQDKSTMDGSANPQSGSTYERETERTNSRITINSYRTGDTQNSSSADQTPVDDDNDGITSDVQTDSTTTTGTTQPTDMNTTAPSTDTSSTTTGTTQSTDANTTTGTTDTGVMTNSDTTDTTVRTSTRSRYRHARKL